MNMLDRERADFFRALEAMQAQLSEHCVAIHLPIGAEHELTGIVDLLHMCAYTSPEGEQEAKPGPIPDELADQVAEYREKLLDAVVETDEGLMERYLEGQELSAEEVAHALKDAVTRGELFPVACGVATKNLGTTALLDLLVEGVPSPAKKGSPIELGGGDGRVRLQDDRRPVRRPDQRLPRPRRDGQGRLDARQRAHAREGARRPAAPAPGQGAHAGDELGDGDIGAVAKLKETRPATCCSTPSARSSRPRSASRSR